MLSSCADITLQTVTLDKLNNVAVFIIDAPVRRAQTVGQVSRFPNLRHGLSQQNEAVTECKETEGHSVLLIAIFSM
jgi:hypothetical protein